MSCPLCGGSILKGQFFISIQAYVPLTDGFGQPVAERMVMEDGRDIRYTHYGCLLKLCPILVGATGDRPDV